ncbi:MAG: pilus assembly protein PilM [Nitrospirae bacterium]|nr:pilus assembly protein PilM [Nitrospirota bacterium]
MKIAGIDIDKDAIRVVEVQKGIREISISNYFKIPIENGETSLALKEVLKRAASGSFVASIRGKDISSRIIKLPIKDTKKIDKTIPFEAEENFPFPPEGLIIDYQILESGEKDTTVAIVAVEKDKIKANLDALLNSGIDPMVIDVPPSAISAIASRYLEGRKGCYAIVYIGSQDADVGIYKEGRIRSFRNIPLMEGWEKEVSNTLYAYQAIQGDEIEDIYLCGNTIKDGALKGEIKGNYNIEPLYIELTNGQDKKIEGEYTKALGLALRGAGGKGFKINLRRGEFAYRKEHAEFRKKTVYTAAIAGIALLLLILNFSIKYYMIESRYNSITKEIRKAFKEAMPDVKNIVNEQQQLKSAVMDTKKRLRLLGGRASGDITALDLFKEVTEKMPTGHKVVLFEFSLEGDKVRLFGEAASFEAADKIKEGLLKSNLFKEVVISDAKAGVEQNKIKFRINITLNEPI